MKRRIATTLLTLLVIAVGYGQKTEIHILSTNDMHAKLEHMAQLGAIADSLRAIDPTLLVFSAGDNRTGDPKNDIYNPTAYPMAALMNQIGFDATALGNHEFDSKQEGLARLIGLSTFSYLCANIHPDPSLGIHTLPYKVFDVKGVKVGVIGVVQLGTHGLPDSHPDNLKGITFSPVAESIAPYEWLSKECDVTILLSHIGYEDDIEMAKRFPWLDLIIGGHTHTQLKGGEMHNGVLITQNVNKLARATHITLTVEGGHVTDKQAENIEVKTFPKKDVAVAMLVEAFCNNPVFDRVLAHADAPFSNYEELGSMMCDAFVSEGLADVGIENAGGVRYEDHPAGDITVNDILKLDPFGNHAIRMTLTGEELRQMLLSCYANDGQSFPYVGGLCCEVTKDKNDSTKIKDLRLLTLDGKKLNLKKRYRVVTNSYVAAICDSPRADQGEDLNRETSDLIMKYLEKQGHVNYQGVKRIIMK